MSTERHWRAGEKLPPADQDDDMQRRYRRADELFPPSMLQPDEARHFDLLPRAAVFALLSVPPVCFILGALVTWLAMR